MINIILITLGKLINVISVIAPRAAGRIGFRLFCFPVRGSLKSYHHKFLDTAEKTKLEHNDVSIQVYRWGSGKKKILFLHGWQSHTFRWKNYVEAFAGEDYTCYSIDAPGHGLSSGSFLTVPLYSSVIERFIQQTGHFDVIIGHSLGAFTTLYTFFRLPLLPVRKLVLLAPPGEATEFIEFYKSTLKLSDRSITQIMRHFEDVIGEKVSYFSAAKFAGSLVQSGLIIHDEGDDETNHNHSINIHQAWGKSRLQITQGLGHNLKSENIINEVKAFVADGSVVRV